MKVINKDAALTALKCKLREAQEEKNPGMAAITNACITIISGMPEQDVSEGVCCGEWLLVRRRPQAVSPQERAYGTAPSQDVLLVWQLREGDAGGNGRRGRLQRVRGGRGMTVLNHGDMAIQDHEHVVIELEKAVKAFRDAKYSVYTPSDVIEILESITPFSTTERINGLKAVAAEAATHNNDLYERLTHGIQQRERELNYRETAINILEHQISQLKVKNHELKQIAREMRKRLYKAAEGNVDGNI